MFYEFKYILKNYINKLTSILALMLMGFIVFSPFGTILLMDKIGLPISIPELLFLPFIYIFRKRYHFSPIGKIRALIYITIWVLLIFISFIADNYSASLIISSSRTYLTLIIAFLFFSKKNDVSLDDVMYISLGATLGWLYSSLYGINLYLNGDAETISRTGNMLSIPLLISISIFRKHNKTFFFSIILCVLLSLTSGMRRQIVVFIASLVISYGFLFIRRSKKYFSSILMLFFLTGIFVLFLPNIGEYFESNVPQLYYRVFEKSSSIFPDGTINTQDNSRIENIVSTFDNISEFILPRGFISRRTEKDGTGGYIDFPLSELFYMFGVFISLALLLVLIYLTVKCYKNSLENDSESQIFVIMSIILFMLLFLEGTFLSSSYTSPFTGYCLGHLKYNSRVTFTLGPQRKANQIIEKTD